MPRPGFCLPHRPCVSTPPLCVALRDHRANHTGHQASDHQCGKPHAVQLPVQAGRLQAGAQHHQERPG